MEIPSPLSRRRARIEVIPLIDIIFFLLATFVMVSLSMVKFRGVPVTLPGSRTAVAERPDEADVVITLHEDGTLSWNRDPIAEEELAARLAELQATDAEAGLILNGDADARLGAVLGVLDVSGVAYF